MEKLFSKLFIFLALMQAGSCMPDSGLQDIREIVINENYTVIWQANFDEKCIQFNVTAKTTGFVGFGLSPAGGMEGADIFIGGVLDNGTSYAGVNSCKIQVTSVGPHDRFVCSGLSWNRK
jgi:hypothetical protein